VPPSISTYLAAEHTVSSVTTPTEAEAPRDAATLVVLREGRAGPEVLLTVRPQHLRFMGGATVFPGGAVASADLDPRWADASALSPERAAAQLGMERRDLALALFVCALREAFEEVGFIAGDGPTDRLRPEDAGDPQRFLERCLDFGIVLATDRLVAAGSWVTPLGSPVRFNARFFLTHGDPRWEPVPDPDEVESCHWVTPALALDDLGEGRALMAPPTIEMLQRLQAHSTITEMEAAVAGDALTGAGGVVSVRTSPLVHVVLAPNPSFMTGPGTNTYVVGTGPTVVIDPAVEDALYLDAVTAAAGEMSAILVTHRHPDHVGGVRALSGRTNAPVCAYGNEPAGGVDVRPLEDGEMIDVPGAPLRVLHTPGHAPDHVCFLQEGSASLFAGDNILGEGTAVIAPPEGDMDAYLSSLARLLDFHIDRIYPGHFRSLDGGREVIEGYLAHRAERERQIVSALDSGPRTAEDIVMDVYTDTPESLLPVAVQQVLAHLTSMERKGRVRSESPYWVIDVGD
jgi:glyoxylase-like metal-dependent hydrolase (beta-lactamase superfamily II)/8-oxo-dGTP pyrophosphatase MutT (NUDIX family)